VGNLDSHEIQQLTSGLLYEQKRSSLALQDTYLSRRASSSVFSANQSSSNNHQPSPDDWVRQASDLSIGRPNSVDPVPSPSGDVQDENMVSGV
jgi:hypothetical protein